MRDGKERSDEQKVVTFRAMQYAVLRSSCPSLLTPPHLSVDSVPVEGHSNNGAVSTVVGLVVTDGVGVDVVGLCVSSAAVHEHLIRYIAGARVGEVLLAGLDIHASWAGGAIASAGHTISGAVIESGLEGRVDVDASAEGHGDPAMATSEAKSRGWVGGWG